MVAEKSYELNLKTVVSIIATLFVLAVIFFCGWYFDNPDTNKFILVFTVVIGVVWVSVHNETPGPTPEQMLDNDFGTVDSFEGVVTFTFIAVWFAIASNVFEHWIFVTAAVICTFFAVLGIWVQD